MQMINPKSRLEPVGERKTEQDFGFLTDEGKSECLRVGFPDDAVGRIGDIAETLLRILKGLQGLLAIGNVAEKGKKLPAVVIAGGTDLDRPDRAILAPMDALETVVAIPDQLLDMRGNLILSFVDLEIGNPH